ncbi:MAG: Ig-like domain-containing protein [Gemmatimonadota bacterium]
MSRFATTIVLAAAAAVAGCGEKSDLVGSSSEPSPKVLAMSPAPGQEFVADDQAYAAEFSHPMDRSSVEGAYRVVGAHGAMSGTYHWSDDQRAFTFTPTVAPAAGQQVEVRWGSGMRTGQGASLRDAGGAALGAFAFSCTVYTPPPSFDGNGQRIYFTGTSQSGQPIQFRMGSGFGDDALPGYHAMGASLVGMGGSMTSGGMGPGMMGSRRGAVRGMTCASCHGADGAGGRYLAMGRVRTPGIRQGDLAAPVDGEPPYDDASLKRAIAEGVGSAGEPLNGFMPRWTMSEGDLSDLLGFLKTL